MTQTKVTWQEFKTSRLYENKSGAIFAHVNRRLRFFIRGRRGIGETATFDFTQRGFEKAMKWVEEAPQS